MRYFFMELFSLFILLLSYLGVKPQITINAIGAGSTTTINKPGVVSSVTINRPPPIEVSFTKNVRVIQDSNMYDAFGDVIRLSDKSAAHITRIGTTHLLNGAVYYRKYNAVTDTWQASPTLLFNDTSDIRDPRSVLLNDDSIITLASSSKNNIGGDWSMHDVYFYKMDTNFNKSARRSIYQHFPTTKMQRGWVFGPINQSPTNPNAFNAVYVEYNVDIGVFPLFKLWLIRTEDNFLTWNFRLINQTTSIFTESCVEEDSLGRFIVVTRAPAGLYGFFSPNGTNWTATAYSNLFWYALDVTVPYMKRNSKGLIDLIYQERSDHWIKISKDNVFDSIYGTAGRLKWNPPDLYYYNRLTNLSAGTFSLGYPSFIEFTPGDYLYSWAKQGDVLDKTTTWYTRHKPYSKDPAGPAVTPSKFMLVALQKNTGWFKFASYQDGGYSIAESQNIRYFELDLSTDNFSTFVTATYKHATIGLTGVIHNLRVESGFFYFWGLDSCTTYQLRARAVNNEGVGEWNDTTFTTIGNCVQAMAVPQNNAYDEYAATKIVRLKSPMQRRKFFKKTAYSALQ